MNKLKTSLTLKFSLQNSLQSFESLFLRCESHTDFRTQCVIMTLGVGGGISLMTFWNSEKLSNFKAHKLWWAVNELCTRILRVFRLCPAKAHIPISHIFQFRSSFCAYLWEIGRTHNSTNISKVHGSSYLYGLGKKMSLPNAFVFF